MAAGISKPSLPGNGRRRWGRAQLDALQDPYKAIAKPAEPTVCPQCGAVHQNGRWRWVPRPADAHEALCQACHRVNDHYPAGTVTLTGPVVAQHKEEMLSLARHQEEIEREEHPLNRIMDIVEAPGQLVINTTDIHLPRRIVEAQKRAWHGKSEYHYDKNGYFLRAHWHRDG